MAARSAIEWTEATWNPVTGCTKISLGCRHCYAERMAVRLQAMGQANYANGFKVTPHTRALELPLHWKRSQVVFVNSMSDLFHEDIPTDFILRVFDVMNRANWHLFQVLTKRSRRMLELSPRLPWSRNIWMGVTVEDARYGRRIDHLRQIPAALRFLSVEPLLGPMPKLNLDGIGWVIVGGESGPGARSLQASWVIDICNQCRRANVPFFFKQWGGVNKKRAGRELEGRTWDEMPPLPSRGDVQLQFA
ncbi:MAG: phage Gp37/Gp68 family protein [Verrucomicrobiota bacterium]